MTGSLDRRGLATFAWPSPPGRDGSPVWTGRGFRLGGESLSLLSYEVGASGWTDDLTRFHEETAGADHFIDRASQRWALTRLRRYLPHPSALVLDVGCSSGFMLRAIRQALPQAELIGSDYVRGALEELAEAQPDIPLLQFDLTRCPLPDDCVDAVLLLNVLEHIEDDGAAVRQLHRVLRPGGVLIVEVPAGPTLFDIYDKILMHWRRYRRSSLVSMLEEAGFTIREASHLGCFLYPGFWLVKQRNKRFLSREDALQRMAVEQNIRATGNSRVMHAIMTIELALGRHASYPFGIRCLVTCSKSF